MAEATKLQVFTYENLLQYDPLIKAEIDKRVAAGVASSIKTVALDGNTIKFYNVPEPVGATTPVYSIELPETDISGLMHKLTGATAGNLVKVAADGVNVEDAGVTVDELATKEELNEAKSTLQAAVDSNTNKVNTLVGEDANKSVRTIANEELAKQLVAEGAKESLDTLEEIAQWIQSHPDDASAMNKAISDLQALVGTLPEGITSTNVVDYIAEVKATLESAIATAKAEAIAAAGSDAAAKAEQALASSKEYTDAEVSKDRARLDGVESDIDTIQQSLAEGGSVDAAIEAAKTEGIKGQTMASAAQATADAAQEDVNALEERVEAVESDVTQIKADIATANGKIDAVTEAASKNADDIAELKESMGEVPEGQTVVGMIRAVEANGYNDAELRGLIKDNADAIAALEESDEAQNTKISANEGNIAANAAEITALKELVGAGVEAIPSDKITALFNN